MKMVLSVGMPSQYLKGSALLYTSFTLWLWDQRML